MNRTAHSLIVLLAVVGSVVFLVFVGASVREYVLETRCTSQGGDPAWLGSSPDDQRPDGFLHFRCL